MTTVKMSGDEVARRGKALYEENIRSIVETTENIGKMVIIDVETGEYGVDSTGFSSSDRLHACRPEAPLYAIRIGYNVAAAIGGVMERVAS